MRDRTKPLTKDGVLKTLGASTNAVRMGVAREVRLSCVPVGRSLLTRGAVAPAAMILIAGSLVMRNPSGAAVRCQAPAVLDDWAMDDSMAASVDAVAATDAVVVVVTWPVRDRVFDALPRLRRLSSQTRACLRSIAP